MNRVAIRVIGAPLLLAGLGLCVYIDYTTKKQTCITVLLGLFAAVSFHELCAMGRIKGLRPAEILGLTAIAFIFASLLGSGSEGYAILAVIALLFFLLVLMVFRYGTFTPADSAFTFTMAAYVLLLLFVPFGKAPRDWMHWLLFLVATNKGSDMAAYVVGKAIGRHKMAPAVSPNKTWEGGIAGLLAGTTLGYVVLRHWAPEADPLLYIAWAASVTVAAQLGDLVKSAIKRWAGVKDSGRLLPEFGGALDMVDSFILSAPVARLFMLLI